jgi:hypothetical protein
LFAAARLHLLLAPRSALRSIEELINAAALASLYEPASAFLQALALKTAGCTLGFTPLSRRRGELILQMLVVWL